MKAPSFTVSNESITLVLEGKSYTVQAGEPNFNKLADAIHRKDWKAVPTFLSVAKSLSAWSSGDFSVKGEVVHHKGEPVPDSLSLRIVNMLGRGEDPKPLCRYFERLDKNPSKRSRDQSFSLLQHCGIPITEDGCFLAYKGVRKDLYDCFSGTLLNAPGEVHKIDRNKVSDDPRCPCHEGLHVGAHSYARSFGSREVIVKVDPMNVVCVPYDYSRSKMRVCEYEVVGHYGSQLPSTTIPARDVPVVKESKAKTGKPKSGKGSKPKGQTTAEERALWGHFARMSGEKLLEQSSDDLRRYALHRLHIVGGGRIPGGKVPLVAKILEVRDGLKANK